MSFGFEYYGAGSGDGKDGALTPTAASTTVNAYANVTAAGGKVVTLGNISDSTKFKVGTHVLIHISAYTGTGKFADLGRWAISYITNIDGTNITLYRATATISIITSAISKGAIVQAVTMPEYTTVTLNAGKSITCPQFSQSLGYGGIVAFKCSKELIFNGGHINLNGKGLPSANLRPEFNFESNASYLGYENYNRKFNFVLNYPDGSAFIMTEKLTGHEDSRIGNINATGKARTLTTEPGGANIFLAARDIEEPRDAIPKMISKTPSASGGKGSAGCYLATEDWISCDEGLYAYDRLTDTSRMSNATKIKDFGDGSHKAKTNYTGQLNSYASISAMDSTRKVFTITNLDNNGLAKIAKGALVMIRADYKSSYFYYHAGRFIVARVLDYTLNKVTVDTALENLNNYNLTRYNFQMVAIPQFTNFTLSKTNSATPAYEDGRGGIVAIAVNDTCNLNDGKLLVEGKGGCPTPGTKGLETYSNAQMAEKVPIGEGNGSVFILAKNLAMNSNTRIGASWSGAGFGGGTTGGANVSGWGDPGTSATAKRNGSGASGGVHKNSATGLDLAGGYMSNSKWPPYDDTRTGGNQGASILIIADKITEFSLAPLSTGGQGGTKWQYTSGLGTGHAGAGGGCGFGGGSAYFTRASDGLNITGGAGGYLGGGSGYNLNSGGEVYVSGGGSSGFCFVYCNEFESQDTTNLSSD